jgi:hypothetical protein
MHRRTIAVIWLCIIFAILPSIYCFASSTALPDIDSYSKGDYIIRPEEYLIDHLYKTNGLIGLSEGHPMPTSADLRDCLLVPGIGETFIALKTNNIPYNYCIFISRNIPVSLQPQFTTPVINYKSRSTIKYEVSVFMNPDLTNNLSTTNFAYGCAALGCLTNKSIFIPISARLALPTAGHQEYYYTASVDLSNSVLYSDEVLGKYRQWYSNDVDFTQEHLAETLQKMNISLEPQKPSGLYGFLIRASYQDLTEVEDPTLDPTLGAKAAASTQAANPAIASFSRNYLSNSNQWILKGAIFYPITIFKNADNLLYLVPSVSADREFNNETTTNSVDSLIFRLGSVYSHLGTNSYANIGTLRLAGDYATDTDFRSLVAAVEGDWEPDLGIFNRFGIDKIEIFSGNEMYSPLFGIRSIYLPKIRWTTAFHTEYGYTVKKGTKQQLAGDPSSLRVGPILTLSIQPFPAITAMQLNKFQVSLSYEYLDGLVGSPVGSHDFKFQGTYPILGSDNISLTAAYEDGLTPIVKDHIKSFNFGLGVKF